MKIIIVHIDLLEELEKNFDELTDQEVLDLCDTDKECNLHDVFYDMDGLASAWNCEEIFIPSHSYMRVINEEE